MKPVVVKLGGSYAGSPLLHAWVRAVEAAAGRVVLVPGGGPFADAVREAQVAMGFDDVAADAMAMLAMAQFGLALCSVGTLLVVAESVGAIEAALDGERVPVWAPLAMAREEARLPRSWEVTSDSLALWLAWRLRAEALLLVKRGVPRPPSSCPSPDLIRGSIRASTTFAWADQVVEGRVGDDVIGQLMDAHFPRLHAAYPCPVFLATPVDCPAALDPDRLPGIRLAA